MAALGGAAVGGTVGGLTGALSAGEVAVPSGDRV